MTATVSSQRKHAARLTAAVVVMTAAMMIAGPFAASAAAAQGSYEVTFQDGRQVDGEHVHVVESGEYLSTIAADYGLGVEGWEVLFDANETISDPDVIYVGDEIRIPEEGETLSPRAGGQAESNAGDQAGAEAEEPAAEEPAAEEPAAEEPAAEEPAAEGPAAEEPAAEEPSEEEAPEAAEPQAATSGGSGVWDRLAECESSGDWQINTGNGYYGGLQFDKSSWDWAGGTQYAEYPHQASREQQIAVAERLLEIHPAGWGAWPACASSLGLR